MSTSLKSRYFFEIGTKILPLRPQAGGIPRCCSCFVLLKFFFPGFWAHLFWGFSAMNLMAVLLLLSYFVCSSDKGILRVRSPAPADYTFC